MVILLVIFPHTSRLVMLLCADGRADGFGAFLDAEVDDR